MINVVGGASTPESMASEQLSFYPHLPDIDRHPAAVSWIGELHAIVSQNRVYGLGNRCNEVVQELH